MQDSRAADGQGAEGDKPDAEALAVFTEATKGSEEKLGNQEGGNMSKKILWQKCPVCRGVGQVSGGYFTRAGNCDQWAAGNAYEPCRICGGSGIIPTPTIEEIENERGKS